MPLIILDKIKAAQARLRGVAVHTPLVRMDYSPGSGLAELWIKAEKLQTIGRFKLRGAYNRIAQLSAEGRKAEWSPIRAATMPRVWHTWVCRVPSVGPKAEELSAGFG